MAVCNSWDLFVRVNASQVWLCGVVRGVFSPLLGRPAMMALGPRLLQRRPSDASVWMCTGA